MFGFFFFFFKQKTAYEIVSRDWSSDVCSSDLISVFSLVIGFQKVGIVEAPAVPPHQPQCPWFTSTSIIFVHICVISKHVRPIINLR